MAEDGEDDLEDAAAEPQDAVQEAPWNGLGRSEEGLGASWGSKPLRGWVKGSVKVEAWRDARWL